MGNRIAGRRFRVAWRIPILFNQARFIGTVSGIEFREAPMGSFQRSLLVLLVSVGFVLSAAARDRQLDPATRDAATVPADAPSSLTGKERLGRKWNDEQRIDNCHVPIDKRGTRPRPSSCLHVPAG
jgi:hypothetical protein